MDDEFAFAQPLRPTRPGPLQKAHAWATRGRYPRLREFLLFAIPGAAIVLSAYLLHSRSWLSDPLAFLLGLCGALSLGFGFLPPIRRPIPKQANPKSRRAQR